MLRICFQRKNKTLRALLLSNTARSLMDLRPFENKEEQKEFIKLNVESALSECALNSSRAVQIPVQQFLRLVACSGTYSSRPLIADESCLDLAIQSHAGLGIKRHCVPPYEHTPLPRLTHNLPLSEAQTRNKLANSQWFAV